MVEFFESIGTVFQFLINQMSMIGEYFKVAFNAMQYFTTVIYTMPLYFKTVILSFLALAIILMVLNRG